MTTIFRAQTIIDLQTPEANRGRLQRGVYFVVACEAKDGSWCEFDAESSDHAKVLADNAVDNLSARGCSCWCVNAETGEYSRRSIYNVYA